MVKQQSIMESMVDKKSKSDYELAENGKLILEGLKELNNEFSGKSILITGAAGFLGTQFAYYFDSLNNSLTLEKPVTVYLWDNFIRGYPDWVEIFKSKKNFFIQKKDIIIDSDYPEVNFIIHAASIASPIFYRKYPIETIFSNITGLKNLLDFSVNNKSIESVLFFSTSEIYGDPDSKNIPTKETYRGNVSCTGPRACYDESKRLGETLCVNYHNIHKVPVKIARPFNNYGPGLKLSDRRVIPDFFRDIINNENIVLLSDGSATRTFCYISDAIEGYLRILLSDHNGESFNIGREFPEISMLELANKSIEVSKKPLDVEYKKSKDVEYLSDNPLRRCPNIDKAKKLLNFNPKISLLDGLNRTYNYYLSNINTEEL
jgi:dTDP-glucose 4,6-dehydratase/UDP-glucuronate decarboxylase